MNGWGNLKLAARDNALVHAIAISSALMRRTNDYDFIAYKSTLLTISINID
jgi:hypothetical protein